MANPDGGHTSEVGDSLRPSKLPRSGDEQPGRKARVDRGRVDVKREESDRAGKGLRFRGSGRKKRRTEWVKISREKAPNDQRTVGNTSRERKQHRHCRGGKKVRVSIREIVLSRAKLQNGGLRGEDRHPVYDSGGKG